MPSSRAYSCTTKRWIKRTQLILSTVMAGNVFVSYLIVKSHYEEVIVVITQDRGGAEDECNNNDNLRVQWDLTSFYPIVFDVRHIMQ